MESRIFGSQSLNNSQYLVNGVSDQKSARNKRDVEFNFLYFVKTRFNVSSTIIVLFQFPQKSTKHKKKVKISKTANLTKKVHRTKKM